MQGFSDDANLATSPEICHFSAFIYCFLSSILHSQPSTLSNQISLTDASLVDSWHGTYRCFTSINRVNLVKAGLGLPHEMSEH